MPLQVMSLESEQTFALKVVSRKHVEEALYECAQAEAKFLAALSGKENIVQLIDAQVDFSLKAPPLPMPSYETDGTA